MTQESTRDTTNIVLAATWLGMIAGMLAIFGIIPYRTATLFAFFGSGMGGLLAHHVRAMDWDKP